MVSSALLGAAVAGKDCARFIWHWRIFYANNLCGVKGSQKSKKKTKQNGKIIEKRNLIQIQFFVRLFGH